MGECVKTALHASQVRTKLALFSHRFCAGKTIFFHFFSLPDQNKTTHPCPSVLFLVSLPAISDHTWRFGPTVFLRRCLLAIAGKRGVLMHCHDDPGSTQLSLVVTWQWRNLGVTFLQRAVACVRSWVGFLKESRCQPVFRACTNCTDFWTAAKQVNDRWKKRSSEMFVWSVLVLWY